MILQFVLYIFVCRKRNKSTSLPRKGKKFAKNVKPCFEGLVRILIVFIHHDSNKTCNGKVMMWCDILPGILVKNATC